MFPCAPKAGKRRAHGSPPVGDAGKDRCASRVRTARPEPLPELGTFARSQRTLGPPTGRGKVEAENHGNFPCVNGMRFFCSPGASRLGFGKTGLFCRTCKIVGWDFHLLNVLQPCLYSNFKCPSICLFNTCLLSTYYILSTALGPRDRSVKTQIEIPAGWGVSIRTDICNLLVLTVFIFFFDYQFWICQARRAKNSSAFLQFPPSAVGLVLCAGCWAFC